MLHYQLQQLQAVPLAANITAAIEEGVNGITGWHNVFQQPALAEYRIKVVTTDQLHGFNGITVPNLYLNTANNIVYTTALARRLALLANDVDRTDMVIFLNSTEINNNTNPQNFARILAMHECCHGLGFLGLCNIVNNGAGNIGQYSSESLIAAILPLLNGLVAHYALADIDVLIPFWNDLNNPMNPNSATNLNGHQTVFCQLWNNAPVNNTSSLANRLRGLNNAGLLAEDFQLTANGVAYDLFTPSPFIPFTSADHLQAHYNHCLMRAGDIPNQPGGVDAITMTIMNQLGW